MFSPKSVAVRFLHWTYAGIDYGLLAVVVYHGLNGLCSIILDMALTPRQIRAVTGGLWILGIITVIFGIDILSPFLWGRPWDKLHILKGHSGPICHSHAVTRINALQQPGPQTTTISTHTHPSNSSLTWVNEKLTAAWRQWTKP
jgi:hypothetical protein